MEGRLEGTRFSKLMSSRQGCGITCHFTSTVQSQSSREALTLWSSRGDTCSPGQRSGFSRLQPTLWFYNMIKLLTVPHIYTRVVVLRMTGFFQTGRKLEEMVLIRSSWGECAGRGGGGAP